MLLKRQDENRLLEIWPGLAPLNFAKKAPGSIVTLCGQAVIFTSHLKDTTICSTTPLATHWGISFEPKG